MATWVLSANRTGARIFRRSADGLTLLRSFSHEEGRLHSAELGTDRPGRAFDRGGQGRHALEAHHSLHDQDAQAFARRLAHALKASRAEGSFAALMLVAEPHFLGLLREALDETTARTVTRTVAKDFEALTTSELAERLES